MRQLIVLMVVMIPLFGSAQYEMADSTGRVEFYTKWASEKWYKPKGPKVLLIKVVNRNAYPVRYSFSVDVSRNGVMLESSEKAEYCIRPRWTVSGRMNGIVIRMASVTQEDIRSANFELELEDVVVERTEGCEETK